MAGAFFYAGASSIWKVDDESTGYLMKRFYKYLPDHNEAESLRLAQLDALEKYQGMFYWASFSHIGYDGHQF